MLLIPHRCARPLSGTFWWNISIFLRFNSPYFHINQELGDLANILQSVGVSRIPSASLPMFSVIFEHTPALDSRLEFGYWRMALDIPPPTSASLSATLVPVSYQLIYRPVLLSEFLPQFISEEVSVFWGRVLAVAQWIWLNNKASVLITVLLV